MIKSFNTASAPSASTGGSTPSTAPSGTSGGGMNKIVMAVVVLGAIYVGYRFILKPMLDAKKAKQDEQ